MFYKFEAKNSQTYYGYTEFSVVALEALNYLNKNRNDSKYVMNFFVEDENTIQDLLLFDKDTHASDIRFLWN